MRTRMKLALGVSALAAYATTTALAARGISEEERRAFSAANHHPRRDVLKLPEQLGTPTALLGLAAVGVVRRDVKLCVAAPVCLGLEKAAEVATKKVVQRTRPAGIGSPAVSILEPPRTARPTRRVTRRSRPAW